MQRSKFLNVSKNPLKRLKQIKQIWKIPIYTTHTLKTILIIIYHITYRRNITSSFKANFSLLSMCLHLTLILMFLLLTNNQKKKHLFFDRLLRSMMKVSPKQTNHLFVLVSYTFIIKGEHRFNIAIQRIRLLKKYKI